MSQLKKKVKKETSWGIATKAVTFPLFFLINIVLARTLGEDMWGAWSYFFSFFTIMYLMAQFGNRASQKFIAQYNHTEELKSIITASFIIRLISVLFFATLTAWGGFYLANFIERPEFERLFIFGAGVILIGGMAEWLKEIFTGLHEVKYNFLVSVTEFSLKLGLIVVLLKYNFDLSSILIAYFISLLVAVLAGAHFLFWRFYFPLKQKIDLRNWIREITSYSLPLFFISIGFLIATEVDTIMLGWLTSDAETGYYAIAKQLVTKLPHVTYALAMGSMPVFAKLSNDNKTELQNLFKKLLKTNGLIFAPVCLGMIALSWFFIPLIYGVEFKGAVVPLMILSIYVLVFTFSVFYNRFLDFQGKAKQRAIHLIGSLIINIGLNYYLIPKYGAAGAAFSTAIAYLPYLFLNILETNRILFRQGNT